MERELLLPTLFMEEDKRNKQKQNKNNNNKTSWDGAISLHDEAQRLGPSVCRHV